MNKTLCQINFSFKRALSTEWLSLLGTRLWIRGLQVGARPKLVVPLPEATAKAAYNVFLKKFETQCWLLYQSIKYNRLKLAHLRMLHNWSPSLFLTKFADLASELQILGGLDVVQSHARVVEVLGLPGEGVVLCRVRLRCDQLADTISSCNHPLYKHYIIICITTQTYLKIIVIIKNLFENYLKWLKVKFIHFEIFTSF